MSRTAFGARPPAFSSVAEPPRLISLGDAAKRLSLSYWGARDLILAGKLPAVRLNRRILIDPADLERLIAQSKA